MKRFVIFVFLMSVITRLSLFAVNPVKVKAVKIICDYYEDPAYNAISNSIKIDLATINKSLDIIEGRNIIQVEHFTIQGANATLAQITETLTNIPVQSDEVLLVYYSGHGAMMREKTYLMTADEKALWRDDLQNIVSAKNCRFKIIITEACSNRMDGYMASRSIGPGYSDAKQGFHDAEYINLFNNYEGTLHISSSSEGEYAWSDNNVGGFFTHYFFSEVLIKDPSMTWKDNATKARGMTMQFFSRIKGQMKEDLAAQGIYNQIPKNYSEPSYISNAVVASNTTASAPTAKPTIPTVDEPSIVLNNYTNQPILIILDRNDPKSVWDKSKVITRSIKPKYSIRLKDEKVVMGFHDGQSTVYYNLAKGKFNFRNDANGYVDLFRLKMQKRGVDQKGKVHADEQLHGQWYWKDVSNNKIKTTFNSNGSFIDDFYLLNEKTPGNWKIVQQQINGRTYSVLQVNFMENNIYNTFEYFMKVDNATEDITLVLSKVYENNKLMNYQKDFRNQYNTAITMSRL